MLKYLIAIYFIVFGDSVFLLECWETEVCRRERIQWRRLWRERGRDKGRGAVFWWRLASEMYKKGGIIQRSAAKKIHEKYSRFYSHDIGLRAWIEIGFRVYHPVGVVISDSVVIGKRFSVRQCTTIGLRTTDDPLYRIAIGNDVDIGANCVILGSETRIGCRAKIGAMSYVCGLVPPDSTFVTDKPGRIINEN